MPDGTLLTALTSAVVGGVVGGVAAVLSTYWGPRWFLEWLDDRQERKTNGPRKALLLTLLNDERFDWRTLHTLARVTGTEPEECRRLLVEVGARGSTGEGDELWGLLERHPINEQ